MRAVYPRFLNTQLSLQAGGAIYEVRRVCLHHRTLVGGGVFYFTNLSTASRMLLG